MTNQTTEPAASPAEPADALPPMERLRADLAAAEAALREREEADQRAAMAAQMSAWNLRIAALTEVRDQARAEDATHAAEAAALLDALHNALVQGAAARGRAMDAERERASTAAARSHPGGGPMRLAPDTILSPTAELIAVNDQIRVIARTQGVVMH